MLEFLFNKNAGFQAWNLFRKRLQHRYCKIMNPCEYCKIFKNNFFIERLQWLLWHFETKTISPVQEYLNILHYKHNSPKKFHKIHKKHLLWSPFMIKLKGYSLFYLMETFSKMFQCKYNGVFQNGYFVEQLWTSHVVVASSNLLYKNAANTGSSYIRPSNLIQLKLKLIILCSLSHFK